MSDRRSPRRLLFVGGFPRCQQGSVGCFMCRRHYAWRWSTGVAPWRNKRLQRMDRCFDCNARRTGPVTLIVLTFFVFVAGCTSMKQPLRPASHVDLSRYMGDWRVIANIPYFAEKNCFDSIESYALRPDGDIDNWFTCRKKSFDAPLKRVATAKAVVDDKTSNALWHVKFFKIVSVKYVILDVDPNYQWALVGHPSRNYGWVLARSPRMDDATYQRALELFGSQGYDVTRFQKVPQRAGAASAPTATPSAPATSSP